jgi:hypothetical protein
VRPAHGPGGREGRGHRHHRGGPLGPNAAAIATELGVTEAQLKTALESIRPAEGTRPDPAALPQKLADALNIPVATVNAALAKYPRPPRGPRGPRGDHGPRGERHGEGHRSGAKKSAPRSQAKAAPKPAKRH